MQFFPNVGPAEKFARALLPYGFAPFGIALGESRARFDEGVEQMRLPLEQENGSHGERFHSIRDATPLARPT
jgi:hypothetical protein